MRSPKTLAALAVLLRLAAGASGPRRAAVYVRPEGRIMRLEPQAALAEKPGSSIVNDIEADAAYGVRHSLGRAGRASHRAAEGAIGRDLPPAPNRSAVVGSASPPTAAPSSQRPAGAPQAPNQAGNTTAMSCRKTLPSEAIPRGQVCPSECPFLAEDGRSGAACFFKCLKGDECGSPAAKAYSNHTIADEELHICRRCRIVGCTKCAAHKEECLECASGYALDGTTCKSSLIVFRKVVVSIIGVILLFFLVWYLDLLCCRRVVNEEGVRQGLRLRSHAKLRQPRGAGGAATAAPAGGGPAEDALREAAGGERPGDDPRVPLPEQRAEAAEPRAEEAPQTAAATRPLWSLKTNLLSSCCGGPGLTLHMRYQVFVMVLASIILLIWVVMAYSRDKRILSIGLLEAKTPRQLCQQVHEGHLLQLDTMELKVLFLAVTYVVGFVASILFAIQQLRCFQALDDHCTMKDFAALITGLPKLSGQDPQEEMIRELLLHETGEEPVGVSICWDYHEKAGKVMAAVDASTAELEAAYAAAHPEPGAEAAAGAPAATDGGAAADDGGGSGGSASGASGGTGSPEEQPQGEAAAQPETQPPGSAEEGQAEGPAAQRAPRGKALGLLDGMFLDPGPDEEATEFQQQGETAVEDMVKQIESTGYGFAVFKTEASRDAAVAVLEAKGGAKYHEAKLNLKKRDAEPDTVRWQDFRIHEDEVPRRMLLATSAICGALIFLTAFLYLPNMLYQLSYSFRDEASQPSGSSNLTMMAVVFIGNQFLYFSCAMVSERVGFHFEDDREAAYMVFYTCSMALGVVLDMLVTGVVAYRMQVASNAHTYGGKLIKDLDSMQEILESFPMQKALGLGLWQYCFPATFLVGYVGECALAIVPYHFQRLILRSYPGILGQQAERTMASWMVMDTGRYADVLVNLILGVLMFFAPGGYYLKTFAALIGSHIYIYLYDHYRILRCVPGFAFTSRTIDNCAQRMLAVPLGIVLAALVHKANQWTCSNAAPGMFCISADLLCVLCVDVFLMHVALHWGILTYVVPLCGRTATMRSDLSFDQLASDIPATWFSTNPVHCLRSRSFYKHEPPCTYYVRGKEHLMQKNPKANSHFSDGKAESEWQ